MDIAEERTFPSMATGRTARLADCRRNQTHGDLRLEVDEQLKFYVSTFIACSVQHATYNIQHAARTTRAARSAQHTACTMQHASCSAQRATYSMQRAACGAHTAYDARAPRRRPKATGVMRTARRRSGGHEIPAPKTAAASDARGATPPAPQGPPGPLVMTEGWGRPSGLAAAR
jgi:hypothetical protein